MISMWTTHTASYQAVQRKLCGRLPQRPGPMYRKTKKAQWWRVTPWYSYYKSIEGHAALQRQSANVPINYNEYGRCSWHVHNHLPEHQPWLPFDLLSWMMYLLANIRSCSPICCGISWWADGTNDYHEEFGIGYGSTGDLVKLIISISSQTVLYFISTCMNLHRMPWVKWMVNFLTNDGAHLAKDNMIINELKN